jgi:hypothetical protein
MKCRRTRMLRAIAALLSSGWLTGHFKPSVDNKGYRWLSEIA